MAEINVNKLSIRKYLETGAKNMFLIPDYQRPYSWGEDEIVTLWDDITTYYSENNESDYFFGAIVTYKNENSENEIIDGQQRTTTILLLLRAIYYKLENIEAEREETRYLKRLIEPCLWRIGKTTGIPDKEEILISSKVASDKHNEEFLEILKNGVTNGDSRYSANYKLLKTLIEEQAQKDPIGWYDLCIDIIDKTILLPIECEDQDTALTIFSTLNDRGMSLSDSDIFKAKIYNNLDASDRNDFIETWKAIENQTKNSGISIQTVFYYYMFYLRAKENDVSTTTPGLRKYYARDRFKKLFDMEIMTVLNEISNLWEVVNNRTELDEYEFSKDIEIKKSFDILKQYSNEYWKYSVTNYFLTHKGSEHFSEKFSVFLHRLIAYIIARLTINPTLNAVKTDFLYLNRDVLNDELPDFYKDFTENDYKDLEDSLINRVRMYHKATKPLLYILAYNNANQIDLLPEKVEIEHILPRKWTQGNLFGYNKDEVESEIESLGNKIVLDKTTNIQAGNGSFTTKKEKYYVKNRIASVREICVTYTENNFTPDDIRKRNESIKKTIVSKFREWGLFEPKKSKVEISKPVKVEPTPEELEQIRILKEKGLIN